MTPDMVHPRGPEPALEQEIQEMASPRDFGVQSYCFREFKDNATVAKMVREIGLDKIELCAVHDAFNAPDAFKDVVRTYADQGVSIVSLGVQTFTGEADVEKRWFECAAAAGAKHISAHFRVDSFHTAVPVAANLCKTFGVKLGIHCHGGYMFGGSVDVLKHLVSLGGPDIGLCLDTAWCMQTGPAQGDPVRWVREHFKGQVHGVHYKDFVFEPDAQWRDVVVGTGNLDLSAFVQALEDTGFDGMSVIEYEADAQNPVPALAECVRKMREA